jgi:hypothetical protein
MELTAFALACRCDSPCATTIAAGASKSANNPNIAARLAKYASLRRRIVLALFFDMTL